MPKDPGPARRRAALLVAFLVTGLCISTWVSRTPAIRDATGASTAEMGFIIAGLSVGSMIGIALGGQLVARNGARFVILWGMAAVVTGVAVVALGTLAGTGWLVAAGLAFFGCGMGSGEIALNVEGVAVEAAMGRTVVPGLHGSYSLGTCVGGLMGLAAGLLSVPVVTHLTTVAVLSAGASCWLVANLPAATGRTGPRPGDTAAVPGPTGASPRAIWREPRTVGIGVIVLGMALAEGSANDWLPLIVVDGFALSATVGALIYALFGAAMAVGRFSGGFLLDRYGRTPVMLASAGLAVVGIGTVSLAPHIALGAFGVILWGLGSSLGFPVALSAAGDDPADSARRVSAVATMGYTAFLVGPPILGLVGEHVGLRPSLMIVLAAVSVSALFSRSVAKPARLVQAEAAHEVCPTKSSG
ncbi:MFS transporter [Streptomyces sp. NPDC057298]|uniref:MFS transporter n=1 Tax=Streptomyces sp. NPDC057298 TaxID=3346091 RepID=UPI00363E58A9